MKYQNSEMNLSKTSFHFITFSWGIFTEIWKFTKKCSFETFNCQAKLHFLASAILGEFYFIDPYVKCSILHGSGEILIQLYSCSEISCSNLRSGVVIQAQQHFCLIKANDQ